MIKISTKGRYGTRAIIDLAIHYSNRPVLLKDVAKREEIPIRYLEQIVIPLKVAGLVKSVRGAKGGYKLARAPEEIKLSEVINALEGPCCLVECVSDPDYCDRIEICPAHEVWKIATENLRKLFDSITIKDLVRIAKEKRSKKASSL
ncbi:Rrf2 family transcriptional regulator [SCandidatus Aminicenantes bacterium Aminicenantia_JdfR_composite]|jgi:Rrf2 family protein|nr:Rrf2 family transcriptional regulator [SCandidatus Aminicenantes bacterium Aminicenantia_JdfR_composite]MCP2598625.1 Rrf2 family transcriptional regulator [Candidatus Aminicenantes bacterium AC-335-L06]